MCSESRAQLGFSAILPRGVVPAAQVGVNTEVAGRRERCNAAIGRKISLSTANLASVLERTEASHE
jgi:hypothetical protein